MFCPECNSLVYADSQHYCKCPNYKCGYEGTATEKMLTSIGGEVNLRRVIARTISSNLSHLLEIYEPPRAIFDHIGAAFDFDVREMVATSLPMKGYQ